MSTTNSKFVFHRNGTACVIDKVAPSRRRPLIDQPSFLVVSPLSLLTAIRCIVAQIPKGSTEADRTVTVRYEPSYKKLVFATAVIGGTARIGCPVDRAVPREAEFPEFAFEVTITALREMLAPRMGDGMVELHMVDGHLMTKQMSDTLTVRTIMENFSRLATTAHDPSSTGSQPNAPQ